MLKLSQNALGMLIAKYRSVLKKMFLKNSAALAASVLIFAAAPAYAANYDVGTTQYPDLAALAAAVDAGTVAFQDGDIITIHNVDTSQNTTLNFSGKNVTIKPAVADIAFLEMENTTITLANAERVSIEGFTGYGAVFLYNNSTLTANNATFKGNTASYGGAVCIFSSNSNTADNATFFGNSADYGGAAHIENNSTLTANNAAFTGNKATGGGYGYGYGGAVYLTDNSTLNANNATFTGNTADYGGAAYLENNSALNADNATFEGNTADLGGAAYLNTSTLTADNANFTGNTASNNGGAAYLYDSTLTANNATFTGNSANLGGGAIYIYNGSTVNLNTDTGKTTSFIGNTAAGVHNNALAFDGIDGTTNYLNVTGAGTLDMRDVMSSNPGADYNIKITKDGTGDWKLRGENNFGNIVTNFEVNAGTLDLYNDTNDTNDANDANDAKIYIDKGSFTLKDGAVLISRGDNVIRAETIHLEGGSTLGFDLSKAVAVGTINLSLEGTALNINPVANLNIDILALNGSGEFGLLSADGISLVNKTLTLRGENFANTRVTQYDLDLVGAYNRTLTLTTDAENGVVTWTGGDAQNPTRWDATSKNWDATDISGNTSQKFLHGDAVVFDDAGGEIVIQEKGVQIAEQSGNPGMTIKSGDWTFTGGKIEGGEIYFTGNGGSIAFDTRSLEQRVTVYYGVEATISAISGETLTFNGLSAIYGGAIWGDGNSFINIGGGTVFANNWADYYGGAISGDGDVNIDGSNAFRNNTVKLSGGAISGNNVSISGDGASFTGNYAADKNAYDDAFAFGGAISGSTGVNISGDGISFTGNYVSLESTYANANAYANAYGGAVLSWDNVTVAGDNISFTNNSAAAYAQADDSVVYATGGAIYGENDVIINGTGISFARNYAYAESSGDDSAVLAAGGAILGYYGVNNEVNISGSDISFTGNYAAAESTGGSVVAGGGAIHGQNDVNASGENFSFTGNYAAAKSEDNHAEAGGGAIYGENEVSINGENFSFSGNYAAAKSEDNSADAAGGAIYSKNKVSINGENFSFTGNYAVAESVGNYVNASGGAIFGRSEVSINGENFSFSGNYAAAKSEDDYAYATGGAIFGMNNVNISGDNVSFSGNYAAAESTNENAWAFGGAIYSRYDVTVEGDNISFKNNSAVASSANATALVDAYGGAIYAFENLTIRGGDIVFQGNKVIVNNVERPNAVYMDNYDDGKTLTLAALDGKTISFFDPVESNSDPSNQNLAIIINATENVGQPDEQAYTGTVLFDTHHSEVYGHTTVLNGTMELANGATYGGAADVGSFTLGDGNPSVKAVLLSDANGNTVKANVISINDNGVFAFDMDKATGATTNLILEGTTFWGHDIGAGEIDIRGASMPALGTYTLIQSDNATFADTGVLSYEGEAETKNARQLLALSLQTVPDKLQLVVGALENTTLTWSGGDTTAPTEWNQLDKRNWTGTVSGKDVTQFLNGDTVSFGDTGAGSVVVDQGGVTVNGMTVNNSAGKDYTFSGGGIGGTGGLTKTGAGTLTLSGDNTYTGGTLVAGGTLTGNITANSALTVDSGATYNAGTADRVLSSLNGAGTVNMQGYNLSAGAGTFSGVISGTNSSLTKTGAGTLTLSGNNTYTGGTTVAAGTLTGNITNNSALTVNSGATYNAGTADRVLSSLNGAGTVDMNGKNLSAGAGTFSGVIAGANSSLTKTGAGMLTLSGTNSYTGSTTVAAGTLTGNITNSTALTVNSGATYNAGTADRFLSSLNGAGTVNMNGYNLTTGAGTFSGVIAGANSSLTKTGAGTLTLSGTNSYTGSTTVAAGTLTGNITNSTALTVNSGAAYNAGTADRFLSSLNGAGTVNMNGYNLTTGAGTFSGSITGDNTSLIKADAGTLTLSGNNAYTGGTTVTEGTLTGNITNNTYLNVYSGAAYHTGTGALASDRVLLSLNGAGTVDMNGKNLTVGQGDFHNGNLNNVAHLTKNIGNTFIVGSAAVGSADVQAGILEVAGGKTLTVNGLLNVDNGILSVSAGTTAVTAGSINFGQNGVFNVGGYSASQWGDPDAILITSGTAITGLADNYTIGGSSTPVDYLSLRVYLPEDKKSVRGSVYLTWYDVQQDPADKSYNQAHGTFTLGAGESFTLGTNLEDRTGTFTYPHPITNTWDGKTLTKEGDGTLILTGDNTYTGGTNINGGTIVAQSSTALGANEVRNNAGLVLNFNGTFTNQLSGSGGLFTEGNVRIDNANTGFGGTTTISSGTLTMGNVGAIGAGSVQNNAVLALNFNGTFVNRLSGGGSLSTEGNIRINNANTGFSGTTSIISDTLTLGNVNALGTGNVQNGAVLEFDLGQSGSFGGQISGSGSLIKSGGSELILSGNNTYSGATVIKEGSLTGNIAANTALTVASGAAYNNGNGPAASPARTLFALNAAGPVAAADRTVSTLNGGGTVNMQGKNLSVGAGDFSGSITGDGTSLTKTGQNTLTLSGNNTYTGGTLISGGTLVAQNVGALGTGSVQNNAVLEFDLTQSQSGNFSNQISGSGALLKSGSGILTLTGDNSYTGGTTIQQGRVEIGHNNALGAGTFTMAEGAELGFAVAGNISLTNDMTLGGSDTMDTGDNDLTLAGKIGGAGVLAKTGSGNLILTGNNTYTGGTIIKEGVLTGNIAANTALTVNSGATYNNGNGSVAAADRTLSALYGGGVVDMQGKNLSVGAGDFSGSIIGGGTYLIKISPDTLTLSGVSTYSGGTVIKDGTLIVQNAAALGLSGNIENSGVLNFFNPSFSSKTYTINNYSGSGVAGIQAAATAQEQWSDLLSFTSTPQDSVNVHFYFANGSNAAYIPDAGLNFAHLASADGNADTFRLDGVSSLAGAYQLGVKTEDNQNYNLVSTFSPSVAKVYSEAGGATMGQVTSMHGGSLFKAVSEAAHDAGKDDSGSGKNVTGVYAGMGRGDARYETGSHADVKGNSFALALAWQANAKISWGIFGQKFNGSYTTSHEAALSGGSQAIRSSGDLQSHDFGFFAEYRPAGQNNGEAGHYYTAIAKAGRSGNDFRSDNYGGSTSTFSSGRSVLGLSLGGGYVKNTGSDRTAEYYSHFIYTKMGSDSLTDSIGQNINLGSAHSARLLSGARLNFNQNKKISAYFGAGLDYEFGGKSDAYIDGNKANGADLKGLTGILELGLRSKQSETLTVDLGLQGYVGKKRGIGGSLTLSKKF